MSDLERETQQPLVFGHELRNLRKRHGLSQMDLASAAGVAQTTVSRAERAATRSEAGAEDALVRIARVLTPMRDADYADADEHERKTRPLIDDALARAFNPELHTREDLAAIGQILEKCDFSGVSTDARRVVTAKAWLSAAARVRKHGLTLTPARLIIALSESLLPYVLSSMEASVRAELVLTQVTRAYQWVKPQVDTMSAGHQVLTELSNAISALLPMQLPGPTRPELQLEPELLRRHERSFEHNQSRMRAEALQVLNLASQGEDISDRLANHLASRAVVEGVRPDLAFTILEGAGEAQRQFVLELAAAVVAEAKKLTPGRADDTANT